MGTGRNQLRPTITRIPFDVSNTQLVHVFPSQRDILEESNSRTINVSNGHRTLFFRKTAPHSPDFRENMSMEEHSLLSNRACFFQNRLDIFP
jgi:hypothetical protein